MAMTAEEVSAKSEAATVQSLNSMDGFHTVFVGDFVQSVSMLILMFVMSYRSSAVCFYTRGFAHIERLSSEQFPA
jgi:hypothetical protein